MHTGLWNALAVVSYYSSKIISLLKRIGHCCDNAADTKAGEDSSPLTSVEVVPAWAKDQGERLIEQIDNSVDKSVVDSRGHRDTVITSVRHWLCDEQIVGKLVRYSRLCEQKPIWSGQSCSK